jgi:hypothetical protein
MTKKRTTCSRTEISKVPFDYSSSVHVEDGGEMAGGKETSLKGENDTASNKLPKASLGEGGRKGT